MYAGHGTDTAPSRNAANLSTMNISPHRPSLLRPFVIGGALLAGLFECVALWRSRFFRRF
jgi:hypothetical protein